MGEPEHAYVVKWRPIHPENTHCVDLLDVRFDLRPERTSEGRGDILMLRENRGPANLWQSVVLTISAWPPPKVTRIKFANVVHFAFTEEEFTGEGDVGFRGAAKQTYDSSSLGISSGFVVDDRETIGDGGAFCLWSTEESPLLASILDGYDQSHPGSDVPEVVHFKLDCDELGQIHIIGSRVDVETS